MTQETLEQFKNQKAKADAYLASMHDYVRPVLMDKPKYVGEFTGNITDDYIRMANQIPEDAPIQELEAFRNYIMWKGYVNPLMERMAHDFAEDPRFVDMVRYAFTQNPSLLEEFDPDQVNVRTFTTTFPDTRRGIATDVYEDKVSVDVVTVIQDAVTHAVKVYFGDREAYTVYYPTPFFDYCVSTKLVIPQWQAEHAFRLDIRDNYHASLLCTLYSMVTVRLNQHISDAFVKNAICEVLWKLIASNGLSAKQIAFLDHRNHLQIITMSIHNDVFVVDRYDVKRTDGKQYEATGMMQVINQELLYMKDSLQNIAKQYKER